MLCYNFVQRTAETRFRRTWLIPSAQFCLPYVPILLRLFYTHTSYISSKFHSYNYGWKIQSIAMEILVRSQRARGTAKQPCCSDITQLTSSALLLRYLGRLKKSLWADAALQPIIKIAQPVALLRHFQKKKKLPKVFWKSIYRPWSVMPHGGLIHHKLKKASLTRMFLRQLTWSDPHHFHLAHGLRQLCTCLRANSGLESRLALSQSHEGFSEEGCSQLEQL